MSIKIRKKKSKYEMLAGWITSVRTISVRFSLKKTKQFTYAYIFKSIFFSLVFLRRYDGNACLTSQVDSSLYPRTKCWEFKVTFLTRSKVSVFGR